MANQMTDAYGNPMATQPNTNVELRGLCQRETVDILDAISLSRNMSRMDLVNMVLSEWCVAKVREATLIYRAAHGNPVPADARG